MISGMFWFDNSSLALAAKIQEAVDYYKQKYGRQPNLCLVNPSVVISEVGSLGDNNSITVRKSKFVLPNHLWIGIEEIPTRKTGEHGD